MRRRLRGIGGDPHAAGLAAATGLHLCLQNDGIAELVGGCDGRLDGLGDRAAPDGDAETGEVRLALVLVEIQEPASSAPVQYARFPATGATVGSPTTKPRRSDPIKNLRVGAAPPFGRVTRRTAPDSAIA